MTSSESDEAPQPGATPSGYASRDRATEAARALQILSRLARILDVPVERFFEDGGRQKPVAAIEREAAQMRAAYLAITDPSLRRRCLDMVLAASRGEAE